MGIDYVMKISRLTVDKLGVKLYDRVSAVIAELIANSYDADAEEVIIKAPMGEYLAFKHGGRIVDKGFAIEVFDTGVGMTPEQVNDFYLKVGAERRKDPNRGDTSRKYRRKVMGRKGVGKLAPFGICQKIEILTSGGTEVDGIDEDGNPARGYLTAHLILDRDQILNTDEDADEDYHPQPGPLDGIVRPTTGTLIRMMGFTYRKVPEIDDFERQLAQRFGLTTANWKIILIDTTKTESDPNYSREVGTFSVSKMEGTEIRFVRTERTNPDGSKGELYQAIAPDGNIYPDLRAGFEYDGRFYPVTGWMAYSKDPHKDDLMAGVRIYCRGKIAAQTAMFNRKAGFPGEYSVRSYLMGELHADWLDEEEDLIQTDRKDILWSHDLVQAFQKWGQEVVRRIGTLSRQPMKKKTWERFMEVAQLEDTIVKAFPADEQKPIRDNAFELAKMFGQTIRENEVEDEALVKDLVQLSLTFAPHITLDKKLREAAESKESPLGVITGILRTARIAELSSFGRIAEDRVKVITKIEKLKDDPETMESAFQSLITEAPWLVNPQWSPVTANQTFSTLKKEFQRYYRERTGEELVLDDFSDPSKRVDFVFSSQDNCIQIIEIKRPNHALTNEEMERINRYVEIMTDFLEKPGNEEFLSLFGRFHVTLICDRLSLTGLAKTAFEGLQNQGRLTHINWATFLLRTRRMHEEFLKEAERQKENAAESR